MFEAKFRKKGIDKEWLFIIIFLTLVFVYLFFILSIAFKPQPKEMVAPIPAMDIHMKE